MKNFVIINGVNSNTINGLGINELPPISKPSMRVLTEEIDGRDGDITTNLGYSAYDKTITIGLFGTGYDINNIISFFNGEGTITFSNEDDKYYKYKIINQIDYEALLKFKQATITFHCQPFKYPLTETPLEIEYDYIEQTGETLTLNNTGESILKLDLKGNTSQYSTTGTNLIGLTNQQCKVSLNAGDKITVSSTVSPSITLNLYTNYGDSTRNDYWTIMANTPRTIEVANDTGAIAWDSNITSGNIAWVNAGSTLLDYEEYTGGIASPNPDYPQVIHTITGDNEVVVTGKNLFSGWNKGKGINSSTGAINDNSNGAISDYIPVDFIINTNYYISGLATTLSCFVGAYNSNKQFLGRTGRSTTANIGLNDTKFTNGTPQGTGAIAYIIIYQYKQNDDTGNIDLVNTLQTQLEKGNTATTYEPYNGDTYELDLGTLKMRGIGIYEDYFVRNSGKNLIQLTNQDFSIGDLHYSVDGGVLQSTGSRNPEVQKNNNSFRNNFKMTLSAGSYKVNYSESGTKTGTLNYYIMKYSDDSEIKRIQTTYDTFTLTEETEIYLGIYSYQLSITGTLDIRIMLCKDDGTAPIFEPYGTGQWCKYNAIKGIIANGTETFNLSTDYINGGRFNIQNYKDCIYGNLSQPGSISSHFKSVFVTANGNIYNSGIAREICMINTDFAGNLNGFKSWLETNQPIINYILSTPYLSLIEDETLISQLDNIQNAMSYEGQTNVSQVNNDKPFIISAKALEKGSDEVVVNNIGNIYAKPLLALEGNGIVNIYLNNNQVLQANVEDKMNIDIDTLEAYNPDTSVLLNRQVIGNYNSMTIPSGESIIKIDGALDKATISNYTRWL